METAEPCSKQELHVRYYDPERITDDDPAKRLGIIGTCWRIRDAFEQYEHGLTPQDRYRGLSRLCRLVDRASRLVPTVAIEITKENRIYVPSVEQNIDKYRLPKLEVFE